jgi:hypothetical protein
MADLSGQGLSPCRREQHGAPDSYSGQVEVPAPLYHQAGYEHGADDRAFGCLICAQEQQKIVSGDLCYQLFQKYFGNRGAIALQCPEQSPAE